MITIWSLIVLSVRLSPLSVKIHPRFFHGLSSVPFLGLLKGRFLLYWRVHTILQAPTREDILQVMGSLSRRGTAAQLAQCLAYRVLTHRWAGQHPCGAFQWFSEQVSHGELRGQWMKTSGLGSQRNGIGTMLQIYYNIGHSVGAWPGRAVQAGEHLWVEY